ncbi:MAG: universal stress protein [Proteobacteria bacterium]|nr:universal stress protein [Pseudomonadota bacterium]
MIVIDNIFVVIDPTINKQRTLQRAARIAKKTNAKIHAYLCIHSSKEADDQNALKEAELCRYELWLKNIVAPIRAEGIDVSTQIDWRRDWQNALGAAAKQLNSDIIIKSSHKRSATKRMLMSSSDLALFETAMCPVMLVKSEESVGHHRVLAAVDAKRQDERYNHIFHAVIEYGKDVVAAAYEDENSELHVIHAYPNPEDYMHVTDVEKRTGLNGSHVHIVGEKPEQAIVKVAREIDANYIIIGLSTRSTFSNRVFGNTAEWLINNLDQDIFVVITDDIQMFKDNKTPEKALPL